MGAQKELQELQELLPKQHCKFVSAKRKIALQNCKGVEKPLRGAHRKYGLLFCCCPMALLLLWPPWPMLSSAAAAFCAGVVTPPKLVPRGWKMDFDTGAGPVPWSLMG